LAPHGSSSIEGDLTVALFRKLRAILVIALTWGAFWAMGGLLLFVAVRLFTDARMGRSLLLPVFLFGVVGATLGVAFGLGIALAGRRPGWRLTLGRSILLGAFGAMGAMLLYQAVVALTFGFPFAPALAELGFFGGLGALTGVLTHGTAARGRLPAGAEAAGRLPAGE